MKCQFLEPRTFDGTPAETKQDFWQYSEMDCEITTTTELIINPDFPERQFFIDKTLSYGDVLILTFLLLFAIFGIIKIITDFWIPKRIDFKR